MPSCSASARRRSAKAEQRGGDALAACLGAWEQADAYTTRRLLKDGALERTELVCDADGRLFVRKYVKQVSAAMHPYECLCGMHLPFVPDVVQAARVGDELIVVSSYVEGTSLARLVEADGALPRSEALALADCIACALEALHALEPPVIHRDVSPDNIIVNGDGAWLVDFGIARSYSSGAQRDTKLLGTAGFAAPEQYGFAQSDERSDVFALGRVLEFMVTGEHAPLPANTRYDAALERVVERATQMDARARYATVADMRAALHVAAQDAEDAAGKQRACAEAGLRDAPAGGAGSPGRRLRQRGGDTRDARHTLRAVYRVLAISVSVLWLLVVVCVLLADPAWSYAPAALVLSVFWVVVPCALSTNVFGVVDALPCFRRERRTRLALAIVCSFVVGAVLVAVI